MRHKPAFSPDEPRFQHNDIEVAEMPVLGRVTRVATNCPLDTYEARGIISSHQHEAGSRFARDCYVSGASPSSLAGFDRVDTGTSSDEHAAQVMATARMREVMREMGLVRASVAFDVCALDVAVSEWARRQNRSRQWGMEQFKCALDVMVRYYKT